MYLKTNGEVICFSCEKYYTWNANSSNTELYFTSLAQTTNNVKEKIDAELYSECPSCHKKNKHLLRIDIKNQ